MARSQDELRQLFNSATATDADMDEYIDIGGDYNALGPKSKAFYDERKAAREQAANTPGTNNTGTNTPGNNNANGNTASDPKGYNIKSIQQAYYDGTIDKSTRDYMMADAIAKFARNTGRDIGNIGAQFTGGTIDTNRDEALWNKRNEALFQNKITAEQAKQTGSEAAMKRQKDELETEKANHAQAASRLMAENKNNAKALADKYEKNKETAKAAAMRLVEREYALLETAALSDIGVEEHVANLVSVITEAVNTDAISDEEGKAMIASVKSAAGNAAPTVNIGIDNPLKEKIEETVNPIKEKIKETFNPTVEQQADKGVLRNAVDALVTDTGFTGFNEQNAKSDIAKAVLNVSKMDPKSREYESTMRNILQQAGGEKDKHILYELVRNELIDKDINLPGWGGKYNDFVKRAYKYAKDPKFMEEHQKYMMELSNK